MKALKIILITLGIIIIAIGGVLIYLTTFLPRTDDPPDMTIEITPDSIERGKYLANHVTVCMDCHAERDWSKFAGPPKAGTLGAGGEIFDRNMGLPGKFYAPDISPAKLRSWTDGDIYRTIVTGVNREGRVLFPVMPYTGYSRLSKEDVYSIIAYLRTIPSYGMDYPDRELDFPVSLLINTMAVEPDHKQKPDASDKLAYGEYVLNAAGCVECHTPFEKGKLVMEKRLTGGREFPMPGGTLRAPNLTPDKETGIGGWSEEHFVDKFKFYEKEENQHMPVGRQEFNTIMPWTIYAGMTGTDLRAIYAYLHSLKPVDNKIEKWSPN